MPRRLLGPGIATAVMLVVLLGLGTWQVQRLAWKRGILDQISHAEMSPAVPLQDGTPPPFTKLRATGELLEDRGALYGSEVRDTPMGPQLGARLIEPLMRDKGDPILVDRGWVPTNRPLPLEAKPGQVTVEGYARPPEQGGWFTPADDPVTRRFYAPNPAAMGASMGLAKVAPFLLVVVDPAPPVPGRFPQPATSLPRPPNNHLEYAITWYGMAVILLVIFVVWARGGRPVKSARLSTG
jgi:surfeit locus 1 family protein